LKSLFPRPPGTCRNFKATHRQLKIENLKVTFSSFTNIMDWKTGRDTRDTYGTRMQSENSIIGKISNCTEGGNEGSHFLSHCLLDSRSIPLLEFLTQIYLGMNLTKLRSIPESEHLSTLRPIIIPIGVSDQAVQLECGNICH